MSRNKDQSKEEEKTEQIDLNTIATFKIKDEPKINITKENNDIKQNEGHDKDTSTITFVPNGINNDIINNLNNPKKSEEKQSFMQKTKKWLGNAWTNFKNSRFNIFKGEEMEDCLDAHGFPMKIPKRRHNQQQDKKEENKNEGATTIDINNKK